MGKLNKVRVSCNVYAREESMVRNWTQNILKNKKGHWGLGLYKWKPQCSHGFRGLHHWQAFLLCSLTPFSFLSAHFFFQEMSSLVAKEYNWILISCIRVIFPSHPQEIHVSYSFQKLFQKWLLLSLLSPKSIDAGQEMEYPDQLSPELREEASPYHQYGVEWLLFFFLS